MAGVRHSFLVLSRDVTTNLKVHNPEKIRQAAVQGNDAHSSLDKNNNNNISK